MRGQGITIGADYSTPENIMRSVERLSPRERDAVLRTLFPSVMPPTSYQAIGADVDGDGREDTVLDQWLPLTGSAGKSIAFGATEEIEITPQRLFKPGILSVATITPDDIDALLCTAFTIGIEPQFLSAGAVPLKAFIPEATYKLLSSHWAGPGVPLRMSVTNKAGSGTAVLVGLWFGDAVVRS